VASLSERIEAIKRDRAFIGQGELVFVRLVCNRCGRVAEVPPPFTDDLGWHLGGHREDNDLCPGCAS
jgi:hypothetical protein